jgi:hypothetical protein
MTAEHDGSIARGFRLRPEFLEALDRCAQKNKVSANKMIEALIYWHIMGGVGMPPDGRTTRWQVKK